MGVLVPAFLAGLAALSLPLIFHLVRRTPRGRQEFSSLMFLSPTPPRLTRRSRLDQLLLLMMRLAALGLLTLAFSRPFLREAASLTFSDLPGRSVAILLDTSASMRRGDLWTQAVKLAEKELDDLNPQDDVALYTFDGRLQKVVDFEREGVEQIPDKPHVVRNRLNALQAGWGATDLGGALAAVAGEIDSTTDVRQSSREPRIVAISDFQKGSRIDALQTFEWPKRVPVVTRVVSASKTTNASAHTLINDEDESSSELRVRVVNAANSKEDQFHLSWSSAPMKPDKKNELAVYTPPGQSRVVRFPRDDEDLSADRIVLRGDDHEFDNTFYVIPPQKQQGTIWYAGADAEDDTQGLQYYLRLATANDPLRQIEVRTLEAGKPMPSRDEQKKSLIFVSHAIGAEWQTALRKFAESGGIVWFVPRDHEAALSLTAIFEDLEVGDETPVPGEKYLLLGEIDFEHPLFAPFAGPRYGDFTKIHFWNHRRVALKSPATTKVVARFDNREPALLERPFGKGRTFVLLSGWNPDESQLAVSSKFVPLVGGILDLAFGGAKTAASVAVNEAVTLPESASSSTAIVRTPDGRDIKLPTDSQSFTETDRPGIYRVTAGTAEMKFAVNIAPSESNTAPLELEQLEQRGVRLRDGLSRAERIERARQERDTELESRQKVWRWLIVAALGILIAETWWAGRAERMVTSTKEAAL